MCVVDGLCYSLFLTLSSSHWNKLMSFTTVESSNIPGATTAELPSISITSSSCRQTTILISLRTGASLLRISFLVSGRTPLRSSTPSERRSTHVYHLRCSALNSCLPSQRWSNCIHGLGLYTGPSSSTSTILKAAPFFLRPSCLLLTSIPSRHRAHGSSDILRQPPYCLGRLTQHQAPHPV
jgi:hypothetical protein